MQSGIMNGIRKNLLRLFYYNSDFLFFFFYYRKTLLNIILNRNALYVCMFMCVGGVVIQMQSNMCNARKYYLQVYYFLEYRS